MGVPLRKETSAPNESLVEHLAELRQVILRSAWAICLAFGVVYYYSESLLQLLEQPILQALPEGAKHLYFTGLMEKVYTHIRISFYGGLLLSMPVWGWQLWNFLQPALSRKELENLRFYFFLVPLVFLLGLVLCYFFIAPATFKFLIAFGGSSEKAVITLNEYFKVLFQLMLITGALCEFPVILSITARLGWISAARLRCYRRHAYLALSVIAAVATPMPDALSMLVVWGALVLVYEITIWLI